jgi:hypothetical protein
MDEAAKADLMVRFIKLIVLLNAILILIALAVLLYFKVPSVAGRAGMAALLAAAAGLLLYFMRLYRRTKQWLDEEHRKGTTTSHGDGSGPAGSDGGRTD